jgi:hypothetical protein
MATYTATQLYGSGSLGENITSASLFAFSNSDTSTAYFTLETVRNVNGFYDSTSPNTTSGSWQASDPVGFVTSSQVASVVLPPGYSSLYFAPATSVTGSRYYLRGAGNFSLTITTPLSLFASAEKGVWFDPSDISTLFQDAAGTTPVTAVGQPVGKMLDKSGNNAHATQSTAGARPIYRVDQYGWPYLEFNGSSSFMVTPSINLTGSNKLTAAVGLLVNPAKSTSGTVICTGGDPNAVNGTFLIGAPSSTADHSFYLRGTSTIVARVPNQVVGDDILLGIFDLTQPTKETQLIPRLNGVTSTNIEWTGSTAGGGTFGNQPLYIGALGGSSIYFQGHIYQIIVRGDRSTNDQIYQTEAWINFKQD